MLRLLLTIACFYTLAQTCIGQTNITLQINHRLNGDDFAFSIPATNNLGQAFSTDRLEYYLSRISIVHDGGTYLTLQSYMLVNAGEVMSLDLGAVDVNTIEAISFFVGVDAANNHGDPSAWETSHPLAPKFPSMHWGWAAGYRFLAIEGIDIESQQEVQVHALGDENYHEVLLPLNISNSGSELDIVINANYENIYKDIDLSGGLIFHGSTGVCITALDNMRDDVFELAGTIVSVPEIETDFTLNVFPNPSLGGNLTIDFKSVKAQRFDIAVFDILGKLVMRKSNIGMNANVDLELPNPGVYFVNLISDGVPVHTQKIISQ